MRSQKIDRANFTIEWKSPIMDRKKKGNGVANNDESEKNANYIWTDNEIELLLGVIIHFKAMQKLKIVVQLKSARADQKLSKSQQMKQVSHIF